MSTKVPFKRQIVNAKTPGCEDAGVFWVLLCLRETWLGFFTLAPLGLGGGARIGEKAPEARTGIAGNPGLKSWANLGPSLRDGAFLPWAAESAGGAVQVGPGVHSWGLGVRQITLKIKSFADTYPLWESTMEETISRLTSMPA
jgi:hypothetical protein